MLRELKRHDVFVSFDRSSRLCFHGSGCLLDKIRERSFNKSLDFVGFEDRKWVIQFRVDARMINENILLVVYYFDYKLENCYADLTNENLRRESACHR